MAISVDGSVPDKQNYNADTKEYTPDYALTPLVIQPAVYAIDQSSGTTGRVNGKLANIRWHENINGTRKQIDADNGSYEITASGADAGRIKVKRNAEPKVPVTLEFYAEYADNRTGQVIILRGSRMFSCGSETSDVKVELDAADQTIYNPLSDPDKQTVKATVRTGAGVCDASKYKLVWEVLDGATWREAGTDETMDYDIAVNDDGSVTVDRWLMGAEMHLRCRVKYSAAGDPGSVALTEASPQAMASFVRRIPKYDFDISGVPYNIPAGLIKIAPEAVIRTAHGVVENAEKELLPLWYMATNKAAGSLSYSLAAHGKAPVVPTAKMDKDYGGVIGLDVKDVGHAGAFVDAADDAVVCDSDGAVLIIH